MKPDHQNNTINKNEKQFENLVKPIALIVSFGAAVAILVYVYKFKGNGLGGTTEFGELGDYIGGILNPILGFATVALLIFSIRLQMKELGASTKALEASQKAHEDQVDVSKKELTAMVQSNIDQQNALKDESRRNQLTENAETIIKINDALMVKPFLLVDSNTYCLNDLLKPPPSNGAPGFLNPARKNFMLAISEIPELISTTPLNTKEQIKQLHLNAVRDNLNLLTLTTLDLIPMLELPSLQEFWFLRTKGKIATCYGLQIITEKECNAQLLALKERKNRPLT